LFLEIQIQLQIPDDPNGFGDTDRLRQEELENLMIQHHNLSGSGWQNAHTWLTTKKETANRNLEWLASWGDDMYALRNLYRWAHPWKSGLVLFGFAVLLLVVCIFPFHRLLFVAVVASFCEGFFQKHKWKFRKV
jgi:hypothetical protein